MKTLQMINGVATWRELTQEEVIGRAKTGDKEAIRELVNARGGWNSLTANQKEKVTRLLLGENIDL